MKSYLTQKGYFLYFKFIHIRALNFYFFTTTLYALATEMKETYLIAIADSSHHKYAEQICIEYNESAKQRGTGIATRTPEYLQKKMDEGKAIIALTLSGEWAGFCYIETWGHGKFVANSGLIVSPKYRQDGLAKEIKKKAFSLSREKYPEAQLFGLTTGLAVMKINAELGYKPVTYSELTDDDDFWAGCKSCVNYPILLSKERKNCLCTAMLYNPEENNVEKTVQSSEQKTKSYTSIYKNVKKIVKSFLKRNQKETIL